MEEASAPLASWQQLDRRQPLPRHQRGNERASERRRVRPWCHLTGDLAAEDLVPHCVLERGTHPGVLDRSLRPALGDLEERLANGPALSEEGLEDEVVLAHGVSTTRRLGLPCRSTSRVRRLPAERSARAERKLS